MLIRMSDLERIRLGEITVAFRMWNRPSVTSGGSLQTALGKLEILQVDVIPLSSLRKPDAIKAGFTSLTELKSELAKRAADQCYRIRFGKFEKDPRINLRKRKPGEVELAELHQKLTNMDKRSQAPWTYQVLRIIDENNGCRAGDLCGLVNQEKNKFKPNVRKLKNLGLTESLGTGYKLSPRGRNLLDSHER